MPRRGLVLEGGGAKGAFAYGCLRAFEERGIKFDAIAGTSVGALNGLLWASHVVTEENAIWETITQKTVFDTRPAYHLLYLVAFFHLVRGFLQRMRPLSSSFGFKLRLAMALPRPLYLAGTVIALGTYFMIVARASSSLRGNWIASLGVIAGVGLCLFAYMDLSVPSARTPRIKLTIIGLTCLIIVARFALMPDTMSLVSDVRTSLPSILIALFYISYFRWSGAFGLSNAPLKKLIQRLVERGIETPLYVTVAEDREFYDPDNPRWEEGRARNLAFRSLESERQFFPRYFPVHSLDTVTATEAVLASAALPFGLVNAVTIGNTTYVDGGVVDNCPIYPLIVYEQCDEIIVIKASPVKSKDPLASETLATIDRLNRIRDFVPPRTYWQQEWPDQYLNPLPRPYQHSEPPVVIPLKDYSAVNSGVLFLGPLKDLGDLRSGTMNFTAGFTVPTMKKGYAAALDFIQKHALS